LAQLLGFVAAISYFWTCRLVWRRLLRRLNQTTGFHPFKAAFFCASALDAIDAINELVSVRAAPDSRVVTPACRWRGARYLLDTVPQPDLARFPLRPIRI
jgi:hypothetical protein